MHPVYRRQRVLNLLTIQLLFVAIFVIAFVAYTLGQPVFYTGLSYVYETVILMCICLVSLANIVYELMKVK